MVTPDPKKLSLHRLSVLAGSTVACLSLLVGFSAAGTISAHPTHANSSHTSQHGPFFFNNDEDNHDENEDCEECHHHKKVRIEQVEQVEQVGRSNWQTTRAQQIP